MAKPVRFTQSARRHRIGKAHAIHIIAHADPERVPGDDEVPDRLVWIGADDRGVPLEVVAVVLDEYLLVIHVMPHQFRRRNQ